MRRAIPYLIVALVALSLYARTASFDYVRADDRDLIAGNQKFLADVGNVPRAFARSYFEVEGDVAAHKTYYRPVTVVSFMLDAARGGAAARGYHATNVVLHASVACLLLALSLWWGAPLWAALGAALLFAVHPVNVQAVAWIAGRNDLLVALFGLVSLIAWSAMAPSRVATALAVAIHTPAFALALFSKEIGIAFPIVAVIHQRLVAREPLTGAQRIALAGDGVIAIAWVVLRARALGGLAHEITFDTLRVGIANLPQLLMHAGKMLLPVRLNVSPGVDWIGVALGAIAVALFVWLALRAIPKTAATLAGLWTLLFLLPTLLVPGLPAYEHRAYVPLAGVLTALAIGMAGRKRPRFANAGIAIAIAILTLLTLRREDVFRDAITYWADGTRDAQFGAMAHVNLGQLLEADGHPEDARREYLRALERDPNTPKAHNNLGVVLMNLGEPELALDHFKQESVRHPANPDAWFNLGVWAEEHGRPDEARRYYRRAIDANRNFLPAYERLGIASPSSR